MNNLSIRKMNGLTKGKKKGFTLVELIIVIAIIAVLAAIAIPKFGQITRDANRKADIATAKNIHGIAAQILAEDSTTTEAEVNAEIPNRIDGAATMPLTKLTGAAFTVDIEADGDIVVGETTDTIYPTATGAYLN